jgi:3-oxoacyl-[acyl-carrier protein] reductase
VCRVSEEDLRGRVALVTGGSGGIGRALVQHLVKAGCHVAVTYVRGEQAADEAVQHARSAGARAEAFRADLAEPTVALTLAEDVTRVLGPIDVLVAAAGTAERRSLADVDLGLWQRSLAVNLTSPFLLAQRLVPDMAERGFGRVLFISSVAAFIGGRVGPHYAASKAGLHGLTASLAATYAERGVTVNAIAPALVSGTAMLPVGPDEPAPTPVHRLGTPDEIADLAVAMLGNGYLTSKVYVLDGGIYPR